AEVLARAGDQRGTEILTALASQSVNDESGFGWNWQRADAVRSLGRVGHPRYGEFLAAVVADTGCGEWDRIKAAQALVGLGEPSHPAALDALDALAADPGKVGYIRVRAARALAHMDRQRGI